MVCVTARPPGSCRWHRRQPPPLLGEVPVRRGERPDAARRVATSCTFQAVGWCEADIAGTAPPVITTPTAAPVADRIADGATLQIGLGAVPDAVAELLVDRRDLGIHTELLGDGVRMLIEAGAATGARKTAQLGLAVTGDAVGSAALYDFLDDNRYVAFWPVEDTNNHASIAALDHFVAINATMQVDLLGQCASESLGTHYVSSTGGQADFMRGATFSKGGHSFIVTHATAVGGTVSRIVPTLTPGAVVSTHKNVVDKIVTEFGVAELRGRTIAERARALIAVAHPDFRDDLHAQARTLGYV
jgi:acyl-CoA hydrolase